MKQTTLLKTLFLSSLFSLGSLQLQASNLSDGYCAAIRGNGDAMPAHWGAMSRLVQEYGMPKAMSGGSSASITMFLLDSLDLNLNVESNEEKALMIKSFQGYLEAMTQTPEGQAITSMVGDFPALKKVYETVIKLQQTPTDPDSIELILKHLDNLQLLLDSPEFTGLINNQFTDYLTQAIREGIRLTRNYDEPTYLQFSYRKEQIIAAVLNFGEFNAQTDATLFFRPGLIDFTSLSGLIGHMADFYSGIELLNTEAQKLVSTDMHNFLDMCAKGTEELTWREITVERPFCQQLLTRAVLTYLNYKSDGIAKESRIFDMIGDNIASFPSTSILKGDAHKSYLDGLKKFQSATNSNFASEFTINQSDLAFGYWGTPEQLSKVKSQLQKLFPHDVKSQKFLALGQRPWIEALATSPAEPGLSSLIPLTDDMTSAGGWSDLHPTLILRAHGCDNVIYVTRKGGESFFAQGVISRLTQIDGLDLSIYDGLDFEERYALNAEGNPHDIGPKASTWSRLYNMANPKSSLRKSMDQATAILCTDWDRHSSRENMDKLIADSMRADLIFTSPDKENLCL